MSSKRRVYEVARELGMDNKAFLAVLESVGVADVKNHMSVLTTDDEARVKRHLGKESGGPADKSAGAERPRVVKRPAVVRRRKMADGETQESEVEQKAVEDRVPEKVAAESVVAPRGEPDESTPKAPAPTDVAPRAAAAEVSASSATAASAKQTPTTSPSEGASLPKEEVGAERLQELASDKPAAVTPQSTHSPKPVPESVVPSSALESAPAKPAATSTSEAPSPSVPVQPVVNPISPAPAPSNRTSESEGSAPRAAAPSTPTGVSGSAPAPAGTRPSVPPRPSAPPSTAPPQSGAPGAAAAAIRPSTAPKRGIDVWEGRPGVPMHNHRPGPRRVQYDAKAPAPGGVNRRSGPQGRMVRGGPRQRGIGSFSKGRGGGPVTKERNAHKKVVRIEETVTLQNLAGSMGVKTTDMLRKLFQLGMSGININSTLDADTAKIIGEEFGWEIEDVALSEAEQLQQAQGTSVEDDKAEDLAPRPPVVTVMGHVDHGKTSLLDAMRQTNVAAGESGGITQHIGAYSVTTSQGNVTFLDTPGHAAFTQMRARGAKATDIVVLVVAADDGVMPQTKEAIAHARSAGVPIVVAINKCDKPEAQPERVRRELSENGLVPEEWGGDVLFCEVSAHTKAGIPELLEKLALQAEVMDLKANPDKPASGIVVESQLDRGRGPVATVLVNEGTLRRGDVVLAGAAFGKVRAMHDWNGRDLKKVEPSEPVVIIGLSEVPRAGDQVYVVKDLKTAQSIAETRKVKERRNLAPSVGNKPRTLEEIAQLMSEAEQLELKVIVKADVGGSAEAVSESLVQLSTEKVRVSVVLQAAGAITENDVNLAVAAGAIIVGFNVKPAGKAAAVAQREGIEIRQYSIIYNLLDDVKLAMEGLLAPKLVEKELGTAEVRQTFRISKTGTIAGCMVTSGLVRRGTMARLIREGEKIWEGKVVGLKRFKEDVREVKDGFECGISLESMNALHVGDIIEIYELEEVKQSL